MWHRNIVFHLITFIQYYYLYICLQFTLTLWFSILTNITPPNCIIYCNLCVACRTKVYLNQCFCIYFNNFGIYNFSNGEAFSSSSVNSMLILLLPVTVVDSVDVKMWLVINVWILIFFKIIAVVVWYFVYHWTKEYNLDTSCLVFHNTFSNA